MSSIKSASASASTNTIDEGLVLDYLRQHPDFFRQHPKLLGDLSLPHATAGAASLIEKQVAVLRERSISTRHKLSEFVEAAKENDALFEKTQQFVLAILTATTLQETFELTLQEMRKRFDVENAAILLLCNDQTPWQSKLSSLFIADLEAANAEMPGITSAKKTFCTVLRNAEANFIFKQAANNVGSTAIALRNINDGLHTNQLLFAVAHHDPEHYNQQTGTLFVDFIADILQTLTNRLQA